MIARYRPFGSRETRIGVCDRTTITELPWAGSLAELWHLRTDELRARLNERAAGSLPLSGVELLAPVDGRTEVWACGVTYQQSREARMEDSTAAADVYELVYDAERPELFFKSVAWRTRGPGEQVAIREDSSFDVPEPELALVINRFGEIAGYAICNDMSSRSIEGENPLYLPQAKVYSGSCALGPWIRPAWETEDPYQLGIFLSIDRDGRRCWQGRASTAQLHRRLNDLAEYLMRGDSHPDGVVLSTGTCLVPPSPFTLQPGDIIRIEIDGIGSLVNPVVRGHVNGELP